MAKESGLQTECALWYRNIWYKNQDGFWATNNEGRDVNTNGNAARLRILLT